MKRLTPRQIENLSKYGQCWTCGSPREVTRTEEKNTVTMRLVCPKGHPQ